MSQSRKRRKRDKNRLRRQNKLLYRKYPYLDKSGRKWMSPTSWFEPGDPYHLTFTVPKSQFEAVMAGLQQSIRQDEELVNYIFSGDYGHLEGAK